MRTPTTTPTAEAPADPAQRTRVAVTARGGRVQVTLETGGAPGRPLLRPMLLAADDRRARVALVPDGALLLAGDAVRVQVEVGPGVGLELIEPGGTVAYDMRGGEARWDVECVLGEDARLAWPGQPFVVAAGARVRRRTGLILGGGARVAMRETLVLGRSGEPPGDLHQTFEAARVDGTPVLLEDLHLHRGSVGDLLGGHRVLDTVLLLGAPSPWPSGPECLVLDRWGALARRLADETHRGLAASCWSDALASLGP